MHLISRQPSNHEAILMMYKRVFWTGIETEVRGQKTKNVRNLAIVLNASEPILTNFKARKLNLNYCKKEWLWYLGADKFDTSIEQHASMWAKLKQADGSFNSNYGQYIFASAMVGASQFEYCYDQLVMDPGSRRASIVLLHRDHLFPENTDTVCTYSINFCIENGRLHMTVMMRSNDAIFGFTNDAFCFQQVYTFMLALLREKLPQLVAGTYTHFTNSMHVYERHYDMIQQIIEDDASGYEPIVVPSVSADEARQLIMTQGRYDQGDYAQWLHS